MSHHSRTPDLTRPSLRRRASSAVLAPVTALSAVLLAGVNSPAAASPSTWEEPDNPAFATVLLVLGGSVVGVIALITLLVYLPSMTGRGGSGDLVYSDPEWFGGPRTGVKGEPADAAADSTSDTGGSGARW